MRLGLLLLVPLVAACSRLNPAYDEGDAPQETTTSGSSSGSRTAGPDDGVDAMPSSTGGSSEGDGADSTSMGSTTAGADGTTGPVVASTGDCEPHMVALEPLADTFIQLCEGLSCHTVDFGASPQELIEGTVPAFQSYLLMSFDLAELELPHAPLSATLSLFVGHAAPMGLEVFQVHPFAWDEGDGIGHSEAGPNEATWEWSSNPAPWTTPRGSGTFEVVIDDAASLGEASVPAAVGSHLQDIVLDPVLIEGWIGGSSVIHLVVTKVGGGEVIAFSRESFVSPTLMISGC